MSLDQVIKDVVKQGKLPVNTVSLASSVAKSDVRYYIHTGNAILDYQLGYGFRGGMPVGRITEIYGAQSEGKTTLGLHIIANAQAGKVTGVEWVPVEGGVSPKVRDTPPPAVIPIYVDTEYSLDRSRAATLGVDLDGLIYMAPTTIEQAFDSLDGLLARLAADSKYASAIKVIVFDTLAATPTSAEMGGNYSGGVAEKARIVKHYLRKYTAQFSDQNVAMIFLNQVMDRIGMPGIEAPGGRGIRHHATHRFRLQRTGHFQLGQAVVGIETVITLVKSKLRMPGLKVYNPIRFDTGIDNRYAIFEFLHNELNWRVNPKSRGNPPIRRGAWNSFVLPNSEPLKFRESEWGDLYDSMDYVREWCGYLVIFNITCGIRDYEAIRERMKNDRAG